MNTRDIYIRHTGTDGNSFVQEHRVWDADRFLTARVDDAKKANEKARTNKAKVEVITREQYRAERS